MMNIISPEAPIGNPDTCMGKGILPSQDIRRLVASGAIYSPHAITENQIQPASLDLRLGATAYRIRSSFLPGSLSNVEEKISDFAMHKIDLHGSAVLERGCVYLVQLMENLRLDEKTAALVNPKSSIGRLDVFTRLITDKSAEFDRVRGGYCGPLYAEISPLTFSIVVRVGDKLSQMRLKHGSSMNQGAEFINSNTHEIGHKPIPVVLPVTVDTKGQGKSSLIGYKAKKHAPLIDINRINHYDVQDFWEPIIVRHGYGLTLNPDDFYILASKEPIIVPPDHAAEMVAYDTLVGEFRVHYAGFFDPGFGHPDSGGSGSKAVLEVRSHQVPFMIEDGQIVARLIYEKLASIPDKVYSASIGSSYQRQGLELSKQFRP